MIGVWDEEEGKKGFCSIDGKVINKNKKAGEMDSHSGESHVEVINKTNEKGKKKKRLSLDFKS